MQPDPELEQWRRDWQAQDVIPPEIRQRVDRQSRRMRRSRIFEIVNTMVIAGGSLALVMMSPRPEVITLAVAIWIFFAIGWATSIALTRGAWRPAAATTAAFLELSILRGRRGLHALAAQCVLYAIILVFDLVWLYHYRATASVGVWAFLISRRILPIWPVTAALAGTAWWYSRKLQRELRNLLVLQRQVVDEARP